MQMVQWACRRYLRSCEMVKLACGRSREQREQVMDRGREAKTVGLRSLSLAIGSLMSGRASDRTSKRIFFFSVSAGWLQAGSRGTVIGGEVMIPSGAKGCESRCTMLLAGRRSLWDWLAGGDFSDTILGLVTIPVLGVAASLLSGMIRPFIGASAATVGFVCGLGARLLLPLVGPPGMPSQGLGRIGAGDEGSKL